MKLELQNSASIQPRKSLPKLGLSNYFRRPTPDSLDQVNSYVEWILKTRGTVWHMHEAAKKSLLFAKSTLHSDPSKSFCRNACKMSTTDSLVSDDSLLSVRSPRTMLRNFHAVLRIVAIRKWDLGAVRWVRSSVHVPRVDPEIHEPYTRIQSWRRNQIIKYHLHIGQEVLVERS